MEVTICIGTFGSTEWETLARGRAIPSAEPQAPVIHVHGETLAQARNAAIEQAHTEWVICLDADDQLAPGYVAAMSASEHEADLLGPAVSYVRRGEPGRAKVLDTMDLRDGNMLVIGTAVRRQMVLDVGGFAEWPLYEDWALWQLCQKVGATIAMVPGAIYLYHMGRADARNREPSHVVRQHWHDQIRRHNFPELYDQAAA